VLDIGAVGAGWGFKGMKAKKIVSYGGTRPMDGPPVPLVPAEGEA
jgi:hypothetical protein